MATWKELWQREFESILELEMQREVQYHCDPFECACGWSGHLKDARTSWNGKNPRVLVDCPQCSARLHREPVGKRAVAV